MSARLPCLATSWEIHFATIEQDGECEVHEVMTTRLGMLGSAALAMIGKFPVKEVPRDYSMEARDKWSQT